ncbi:restriction endonuclease subunit S [Rothia dentocariosa]|uniref:restriction endonuclease subunit S n=1 Tax=Rothia dentocariosa TaxID=2047 RepID=UPI001C27127F|nr:restriction endonuclease subunit S [Rothia dentocariosa]
MSEETKDMPKVSSDMEAPKALNYIEKLVAELCPGGVEYVELNKLLNYEQPGKYTVSSTNYDDSYSTPVLTAGKTFILGYTDEVDGIYAASKKDPVIIFDDFTTAFKWVDFNFKIKSTAIKLLTSYNSNTSLKYIYYAMQCIKYETQDHARQWISNYSKFLIPLPPVEVQNAIVEILDKFTKLEAELEAELAARRAQYEYYRNSLFENLSGGGSEILGNLGKFIRGNGLQKKDLCVSGNPAIHYGQIYTQYGIWTHDTMSYIDESNYKKLRKAQPGSIIIATTSENDEDLGKAVAWLGNKEVAVSGDSYIYKHSMNPKYVSYFFSTYIFHDQKKKYITGTKVRRISGGNLAKIKIPIPSLAEQERIVKILDKFDALVNDISSGLPAEIEARRKQYEYYRDRLLTFPRASDSTEHKQ